MLRRSERIKEKIEKETHATATETKKESRLTEENKIVKTNSLKMATDTDKLLELHNLLIAMSDQFQAKLQEISNTFTSQLASTKTEMNEEFNLKLKELQKPEDDLNKETLTNQSSSSILKDKEPALTNDGITDLASTQRNRDRDVPTTSDRNIVYIQSDKLIDLPVFSGKPSEWPTFIGQFIQSSSKHAYDDVQNNQRLTKALIGPARELVEPLLINPTNVKQIIEDLEERFGHPDLLADEQIDLLKNFPTIPESKLHSITELADKVRNCKNFLSNCGLRIYLDNPLLVREVSSKLPVSKRLEWAKYELSLDHRGTLEDLSEWLTEVSRYIRRITLDNPEKSEINNHIAERKRTLLYTQKTSCCFCQDNHQLESCPKFREVDATKRYEFVRQNNLCFSCLKRGHSTTVCRNRKDCGVPNCRHKHNALLHFNGNDPKADIASSVNSTTNQIGTASPADSGSSTGQIRIMNSQGPHTTSKLLFQVIPIKVFGPKGSIETYAMFDSGADLSIIDEKIATDVGIDGPNQNLNVKWIDDNTRNIRCKISDIQISGVFENAPIFQLHDVRIIKQINLPSQSLNAEEISSRFKHLAEYPVTSYKDAMPTVLLGLKDFKLSLPSKPFVTAKPGPTVTRTKLGWMMYGATDNTANSHVKRICTLHQEKERLDELNTQVQKFINTDDFGCGNSKLLCEEDKRCLELLQKTTRKVGDKFECGLLWKKDNITLPDNFLTALNRLKGIEKKMETDTEYHSTYVSKIEEYVKKGYAIEMTKQESEAKNQRTWYLPHFGVTNKNKPGKFRLVFDAASKTKGTSLNNSLLSGPDLNQPLISVLFKFRERRIGVCGDIQEMFHQIQIAKEDQDSQRFIFRKSKEEPLKFYKMQVMTFGAACSPTTAQYVKNANADSFQDRFPKAAEAIRSNHYVDDYVCSFDTEDEAIEVTKQVIDIHANAGFLLRNFISNSDKVSQSLKAYQSLEEINMDIGNDSPKILGLFWNLSTNCFNFKTCMDRINSSLLEFARLPTKRELLSIVMSLFDPFGFLSNYTINGKLLLQSVWKAGIGWDTQISGDLERTWKKWLEALPKVETINVPRCYGDNLFSSKIQLHIFVDASSQAFAAVAYLRITSLNGSKVSFICAKTKCSPLKYVSIPRLELQAAVLGTRLARHIKENQTFKVDNTFYWSDSTTVLFWIKNERRQFKQFVANRISEILDSSNPVDWHKVPTKENTADQGTRAVSDYSEIFDSKDWFRGPVWLESGEWPTQTPVMSNPETDLEVKGNTIMHMTIHDRIPIMNFESFSSFTKLIRTMAWALRFIHNTSTKTCNKNFLSSEELKSAELKICQDVQKDIFRVEYSLLQNYKRVEKSSKIHCLNPYLDEYGVIRVNGRIDNAPTLTVRTKRPIIMPKDHYVTKLIVKAAHDRCQHHFQEAIICNVRNKFWINDLRSVVKKIKAECNTCKLSNAKPSTPLTGMHPVDRLTPFIRPFTFTGVDYFGPIQVSIGRRREKRWVAIFTCLTIRAVHTEIVENLSSDACILCLKNFMNIRGVPKRMRSDNGTCFIGINNELKKADEIFEQEAVQNELAIRQIEWKFNLPSNPSAGGCWEIMVKMVKRVLNSSLKETSPRIETLRCFLIEACNIINSRPLTHVPTTTLEEDPLTPNHFLIGENNSFQSFAEEVRNQWSLRKQWRIANALKNSFWKRFSDEYIPTINKRMTSEDKLPPIQIGDIVLIADDNLKRNAWPRGLVINTFPGKDGIIRGVLVKVQNKEIKRPVCKLAVIGHDNTSKENTFTVLIEGNIGCGKSTLLENLKSNPTYEVIPEPIEKWTRHNGINLLEKLYEDPKQWGSVFQNYVYETMLDNHMIKTSRRIKIMERSLFSAKDIFTKSLLQEGSITNDEYTNLMARCQYIINKHNVRADLTIYIRTNPKITLKRLLSRGRKEENQLTLQFISKLHDLHEAFIKKANTQVMIVNGDKTEEEVASEVDKILNNLSTN